MIKKKLKVVAIDKEKDSIVLEEKQSSLTAFLRKNRKILFLTCLIISVTSLIVAFFIVIKNLNASKEPKIEEVYVDSNLKLKDISIKGLNTGEESKVTDKFKTNGEILLTKTVEAQSYVIKFFSDGTALKIMKTDDSITRIGSLNDGSYGITNDGIIDTNAKISDVTIKETKSFSWGNVTYYNDGSANISTDKINIFVRNGNDINDKYISSNKVSYLNETRNNGNIKINYYYDGTIEVVKNGTNYLIRNAEDINITESNVSFLNNNASTIIKTQTTTDGKTIDYYTDGGAIIHDGTKAISIRKSNSIVIKNNQIFEIVDSIYVTETMKKDNTIYYSNGSGITNYNNEKIYVEDNSSIKYINNGISSISLTPEKLSNEKDSTEVKTTIFETVALVETSDYKAIVKKDRVLFDTDGNFKELLPEDVSLNGNLISITNNTDNNAKYKIVIEEGSNTSLNASYINYKLSVNDISINEKVLNTNIWTADNVTKTLSIKGTNYILLDDEIEAHSTKEVVLSLWINYENISNAMQNKYFYGTIRIYAWKEV